MTTGIFEIEEDIKKLSLTEVIAVLKNFKTNKNLVIFFKIYVLNNSRECCRESPYFRFFSSKKKKKFLVSCIVSIRSLIFKILEAEILCRKYICGFSELAFCFSKPFHNIYSLNHVKHLKW